MWPRPFGAQLGKQSDDSGPGNPGPPARSVYVWAPPLFVGGRGVVLGLSCVFGMFNGISDLWWFRVSGTFLGCDHRKTSPYAPVFCRGRACPAENP